MLGNEYHVIKTAADVQEFQNVSNGLHDGHITHVEYNNTGISAHDNCLTFDYTGTSLIIHVLVTSLSGHPSFEISFHNITEWQVNQYHFSDMIDFSILFLDNGMLLWADDISPNISDLKQGSYVVAESIQYRKL